MSIPARRASAESLSSPYLHDEGDCDKSKKMRPKQSTLPSSLSVTSELNRGSSGGAVALTASSSAESASKSASPPSPTSKERENSNTSSYFQARKRNCQTRKSILVRQSKVDDHRQDADEDKNNKPPRHN